jgi:hypothetical protein
MPWDNWDMDCVCLPFRGGMGKTHFFNSLWTGYGSRCQWVWQELQHCCFSHATANQLDTTVGNIGVNMGDHPSGTLSTPFPMNWGFSEVFLMFCTLFVPFLCVIFSYANWKLRRTRWLGLVIRQPEYCCEIPAMWVSITTLLDRSLFWYVMRFCDSMWNRVTTELWLIQSVQIQWSFHEP